MNILGINQVPSMISWQHDSAASLVKDGKLIACAEEERFNRLRHARGYPKKAIEYCLKEGGIKFKNIDVIAVGYNPYAFLKRSINLHPINLIKNFASLLFFILYMHSLKKQTGAKVMYIDHHLSHAASAYRCSGFDKANILTVDGSGETESFVFFVGEKGKLRRVWDIPLGGLFSKKKWSSIGLVYTRVTNFLNLGVHGEGKTMGLASYGKPKFDFSKILNIENHKKYSIDRRNIEKFYSRLKRVDSKEDITQEHKDLTASLQYALENSVVNLAKEAYEYSGIKNFCLAGGVTLNCNTNTKILEQDFCDNLFVQPAAHDGGIPLGSALEAASLVGEPADFEMIHAYWGPGFSNDEIEGVLKNAKVSYQYYKDIERMAAKFITDGNIAAWFQGRMEMGPRALGNRSILADPTIDGIDDKINIDVKHREVWRPFAPSITEEDASKYFKGVDKAKDSSFMLHTFFVKDKYRNSFPAITHIDGSSRIQTVRKEQNERYYTLLKEIEKINGHPIVLDTSFNDQGEPIICTPKDALRCFFSTGIDVLVIGNFVVKKYKDIIDEKR